MSTYQERSQKCLKYFFPMEFGIRVVSYLRFLHAAQNNKNHKASGDKPSGRIRKVHNPC